MVHQTQAQRRRKPLRSPPSKTVSCCWFAFQWKRSSDCVKFLLLSAGVESSCTSDSDDSSARATLIICPLSVLSNWLVHKKTIHQKRMSVKAAFQLSSLLFSWLSSCAGPVWAAHSPWREARRVSVLRIRSQQEQEVPVFSGRGDHHLQRPVCWLWGEWNRFTGMSPQIRRFTSLCFQNKSPLHGIDWLRVVLDEGHFIRNPNAQMSKAVLELKAQRRWILSGEFSL